MSVGSALVSGDDAVPGLAVKALALALEKAGRSYASSVLMFLTAEFSRQAQQTVTAVARAARCTQVVGGVAAGVVTDSGWVLDRPAVALMVFADDLSLAGLDAGRTIAAPILSYAGGSLPPGWAEGGRRFGGSFTGPPGSVEPVAWQQGRLLGKCSVRLQGGRVEVDVSLGWRFLGRAHAIESSRAYELVRLGGKVALASLMRDVAANDDLVTPPPISTLCAVLINAGDPSPRPGQLLDASHHPVAIVDSSADESLTLSERPLPGQHLAWAIRSPATATADMHRSVAQLARVAPDPEAALLFSCLGRGPYFHGGEDADVDCLRKRFPGLPLIGCYGTGQIAPSPAGGNRLLQNAVVTALISSSAREADV